ncbi:hypothetical protein HGM15179_003090 [Zosterops borbonicus]|uniref:Uncharacterized protein n=1 Tax=Zosterops borbonicus TaxID=364589 RepID=A0A8K1GTU8_9PASS|nr:hypothetical protein HGM15179_003090 [Zosterops borbonicus]
MKRRMPPESHLLQRITNPKTKYLEASELVKAEDDSDSCHSSDEELLVALSTAGGQQCHGAATTHVLQHASYSQPLWQLMRLLPAPGLSSG